MALLLVPVFPCFFGFVVLGWGDVATSFGYPARAAFVLGLRGIRPRKTSRRICTSQRTNEGEDKMFESTASIRITKPRERVYEYLADLSRHAEWATGLETIERVTEGPLAVGSQFRAVEKVPGRFVSYARVTALEPPSRIAWEAWDNRVMRARWEFQLQEEDGMTRLTQRAQLEPTNLVGKILVAVMRKRQIPTENARSLARIKEVLER